MSGDVRPPITAPSASMMMDFPAPVSPVSAFIPGSKAMRSRSMIAIFCMLNSTSITHHLTGRGELNHEGAKSTKMGRRMQ